MLRSALLTELGFRHGFNLRTGGVSLPPSGSGALFEVSQVHGRDVLEVHATSQAARVRQIEADALVAPPGAIGVGVRSADCVPVLIADAKSGAVAAIHAGWRGTACGVVEAGVQALFARGCEPNQLTAAIFPHIRRCCFEVGEDVAQTLLDVAQDKGVVDRTVLKPHVDLGAIVQGKLKALGLMPERVEQVPGCTYCEPERFFSYRRDGQRSGRHLTAIVSR